MKSFSNIWDGGYFEGDSLDPISASSYGVFGYTSMLNVIYQACIKPYVNRSTVALEIGPGRGAFTKAIQEQGSKYIYMLLMQRPLNTLNFGFTLGSQIQLNT